jgi:hypothetical protein
MKKFSLISCFLLLLLSAKAQDKIITLKRDTIHCTIKSVGNDMILYELENNDGSVTGRYISVYEVAEYSRSSHPLKLGRARTPMIENLPENPWCLGLNAGFSAMPWFLDSFESSAVMPGYYKKLKTGFHLNAGAHYMIREFFGLGAEYSFFMTGTSGSVPTEYSPSFFLMGSEKSRVYINYPGVSVLFRQRVDAQGKFTLSESLSAGVLFFRMENQSTFPEVTGYGYRDATNNYLLAGNSFCGKLGIDAEYKVIKAISVGLGGDFMWSTLKKAAIESRATGDYSYSGDKEELSNPMKLSRIDFSLVMRYYF